MTGTRSRSAGDRRRRTSQPVRSGRLMSRSITSGFSVFERGQRLDATARGVHGVAARRQRPLEDVHDRPLVVDDEDAGDMGGHASASQ